VPRESDVNADIARTPAPVLVVVSGKDRSANDIYDNTIPQGAPRSAAATCSQ
jgi:hypothetical protein